MFNILAESLIRMDTAAGSGVPASLPQVYEALMADKVDAFPALRPHQRHAWHAFLVQLGAMALHRAGLSQPPAAAAEWCDLIRGLTPDYQNDEPWQLVVEDITKPAFMQPPASDANKCRDYKKKVETPDELDMLITTRNHDLKSAVVSTATINDWLFALITLQTMTGYDGPHNYGISRMPSGYGNRSAFSITPSTRPGIHIRRDMTALLEHRSALLDRYKMTDTGVGLVWTVRWDGTKKEALLPDRLEPFYIEICRRIRLDWEEGRLAAVRATPTFRRIVDVKGLTGDPWSPIGKKTNNNKTPQDFLARREKLGYERVVAGLTSPDWEQPHLLRPLQSERDSFLTMQLVARGMVRGEGGTEGYHERIIPLRPKVVAVFGRAGGLQELGDIARERIEDVSKVEKILKDALATFIVRGNNIYDLDPKSRDNLLNRKEIDPWRKQLDELVDARFFEYLQEEFETNGKGERQRIRADWLQNGKDGLVDHARRILRDAANSLPCPAIQRYRARVCADSVFEGRFRGPKGLPSVRKRGEG